jgi:voltage-gated potassium channel Kch
MFSVVVCGLRRFGSNSILVFRSQHHFFSFTWLDRLHDHFFYRHVQWENRRLFVTACWIIWCARNQEVVQGSILSMSR